jgi:hypothetical protein
MSTHRDRQGDANLLNRIPLSALLSLTFMLIIGMGIGGFFLGAKGQTAQDQRVASDSKLETAQSKVATGAQLADENLKFCQDPNLVGILRDNGYQHICDLAIVVQTQASQASPAEPGKPGDRGPGPTQEQIDAAVAQYFRDHPLPEGKLPTVEQVATAVGVYLRENPPQPGRAPTADEIAVATASYLAEHAEDFRGKQGPPPSAEDVRAAVTAYCGTNGNCRGPQGPQGVSVTGTDLHRDDQGVCTLYFTLEDPANGNTGQTSVQVRDELCSPPTVVPTTEGGG